MPDLETPALIQCGYCDRTVEIPPVEAFIAGWTALRSSDAATMRGFREARRCWACPDCRSILDAYFISTQTWEEARDAALRSWAEANPPPVLREPLRWDLRWSAE